MAGGIKGITVKIKGDTSGLSKSLSEATTKSTALQKELKGVNTLLKFDPGNMTLLKQKADLLKESIAATGQKLKDLQEIQSKVDNGKLEMTEAEYRNLQREIVSTSQKLNKLQDESKSFGSVAAQQVALVGEKLQSVGGKVEEVGKKVSAASAVAAAGLTESILSASDFEDSMAKVSTIADESQVSLSDLSDQVINLSNETGIAATDIAEATYNAISAGQQTGDAVSFVSNATSLAKAGFTDTGSAIDILTTIMNAYGLEAEEVGKVSDNLIMTQNLGKTTVAELSSSMGKIIPTAKATGVNLDQLCSAYAVMTANGIATAESTTYMNSMLNELGKSGTTAADAFKEGTKHIKEGGLTIAEAMEQGWNLTDVLSILDEQAYKSKTTIANMFGSAEAGKAASVLWDNASKVNSALEEMEHSGGSTATALEKLQTPSQKAAIAMNQLKNAGTTLGQTALTSLSPLIDKISAGVNSMTSRFIQLSPGIQSVILAVLAFIVALGPGLIIIGKLISAVGSILTLAPKVTAAITAIKGGFAALGAAMSANPITIVVAALAALAAGFVYAYQHSETFRANCNQAFNQIKEFGSALGEALVTIFTETIPGAIDEFIAGLKSVVNTVGSIIGKIVTFFKELPGKISNAIGSAIDRIKKWGSDLYTAAKNAASKTVTTIIDVLKMLPSKIGSAISSAITNVVNWGSRMLSAGKNAATKTINSIVGVLATTGSRVKSSIEGGLTALSNWGSRMLSTAKTKMAAVVNGITTPFTNVPAKMVSIGTNIINGIKSGITGAVSGLYESIKSSLSGLVQKAKDALGIHSPSKVFEKEIGENIALGLIQGVNNKKSMVGKSGAELVTAYLSEATAKADKLINSGKITQAGLVGYWKQIYRESKAQLGNAAKEYEKTIAALNKENGKLDTAKAKWAELKKTYDDQIDRLKKVQDSQKATVTQLKAIQDQKKKELSETKKGTAAYTDAKIAYDKAAAAVKKAQEEYNSTGSAIKKHREELAKEKTAFSESTKGLNENVKALKQRASEAEKAQKAIDKAQANYLKAQKKLQSEVSKLDKQYAKDVKSVKEDLKKSIQDLTNTYNKALEDRQRQITSSLGLFQSFENDDVIHKDELQKNLKTQVDALREWDKTLDQLSQRDGMSDGLLSELQSAGVSSVNTLKQINAMTDDELKAYVELYEEKNRIALERAEAENQMLKDETEKEIVKLTQNAEKKLAKLESTYQKNLAKLGGATAEESQNIGVNIVKGLEKGIRSQDKEFQAFLTSFFKSISKTAADSLEIHSPSRLFARMIGAQIPAGIAQGIMKNAFVATDAVNSVTQDMVDQVGFNRATWSNSLDSTFGQPEQGLNLGQVIDILREYGDKLLQSAGQKIILDSGLLVGGTIDQIDSALSRRMILAERG